jgi:hypothetical protein
MATISFKTKIGRAGMVVVPTLKRSHCDMAAFRSHAKYGMFTNSDLFPSVLARIRRDLIGSDSRNYIRLDSLPTNVSVDLSGFLAVITITV